MIKQLYAGGTQVGGGENGWACVGRREALYVDYKEGAMAQITTKKQSTTDWDRGIPHEYVRWLVHRTGDR